MATDAVAITLSDAVSIKKVADACNFNIIEDDTMPQDEIWFEDGKGNVLQKVKVKDV